MSAQPSHDPAVEPARPEASLGDLFREFTSDLGRLVRQEIELARVETRDEAARAGRALGMLGGAAVAALLGLMLLSLALAAWMDEVMHPAVALLIVGVVWVLVTAVLALRGRVLLREVKPLPQTKETLEEDVEWLRQQTS